MKPSSFENAIRLQFDCLARKVIGRTVKNYDRELGRRARRETPFCEMSEMELNHMGIMDEYSVEFTSFDVFGSEVRIYDERLCEAIKELSERRRNILLMSYFLEMTDAEIAEVVGMERFSVCRNRLYTLKLIRDMYEED
ncbi:sigma-70 family RNA polymerase sigma factor [Clostridioides difficile]|nr:sigma-70 family RNA polymerase sigma factor [Clostridioides difficile]